MGRDTCFPDPQEAVPGRGCKEWRRDEGLLLQMQRWDVFKKTVGSSSTREEDHETWTEWIDLAMVPK